MPFFDPDTFWCPHYEAEVRMEEYNHDARESTTLGAGSFCNDDAL